MQTLMKFRVLRTFIRVFTVCKCTCLAVFSLQSVMVKSGREMTCYSSFMMCSAALKGTATLMISMFYQKELLEPWILIQVSSKSVEKLGSDWHLNNSIWPTFSRHFEYLISFQDLSNCLIFSYQYYHSICVPADMQLYTSGKCLSKYNCN